MAPVEWKYRMMHCIMDGERCSWTLPMPLCGKSGEAGGGGGGGGLCVWREWSRWITISQNLMLEIFDLDWYTCPVILGNGIACMTGQQ